MGTLSTATWCKIKSLTCRCCNLEILQVGPPKFTEMSSHLKKCQQKEAASQPMRNERQEVNITETIAASQPAGHQCGNCSLSFSTKIGLSQHRRRKHPDQYNDQLPGPSNSRQVWTNEEWQKWLVSIKILKTITSQLNVLRWLLSPFWEEQRSRCDALWQPSDTLE